MTTFLLALLLGQTVTMPQSVTVAVGRLAAIPMSYDGTDFQYTVPPELDAFREYTTDAKEVKLRVIGYQRGTYRIAAVTCKDNKLSKFAECIVVVGEGPTPPPVPPGPTPIPPGPTPPVPPEPTPPDPTIGPRTVMIVHETADKTPQWATTINQLRTGSQAAYLKSKGHRLNIIDDDSLAGDAKWQTILSGMTLPVIIVTDPKDAILKKQAIPLSTTADQVIALVKETGG